MNVLKIIPTILSFILLGAHFMRSGFFPYNIVCFLLPFLLFVKQVWVLRLFQILLVLASAEWIRTLFGYMEIRKLMGEDSSRLIIILGSVALFSLLSAVLLQTRSVKKLYKIIK